MLKNMLLVGELRSKIVRNNLQEITLKKDTVKQIKNYITWKQSIPYLCGAKVVIDRG